MLARLSSETGILFDIYRFFGIRKALVFVISMPLILSKNMNRAGYEAMGRSKLRIPGVELIFIHPDVPFIKEIIAQRSYNNMPGFEIDDGDIVVDLGANVGVFSLYSALMDPHGKILAVEPEVRNFQFLLENVEVNKFSNVTCERLAISNSSGKMSLYLDKPGSNSLIQKSSAQRVQVCESICIEKLLEKNSISEVDFLKIDIEGSEYAVFEDVGWLSRVKKIAMEVHLPGDPNMIADRLKENGFKVVIKNTETGNTYCFALRS